MFRARNDIAYGNRLTARKTAFEGGFSVLSGGLKNNSKKTKKTLKKVLTKGGESDIM